MEAKIRRLAGNIGQSTVSGGVRAAKSLSSESEIARAAAGAVISKPTGANSGRRDPGQLDAAQFPATVNSDREQPSSPAVMKSSPLQRFVKCRDYVQRLL
jgi:hypothetical protein